jgi:hypothetical protein
VLHVLFRVHVSILQQQINWVGSVSCDVQAVNNSIIRRWLFLCILVDYLRFQNHMHLKIFRVGFSVKIIFWFYFLSQKKPMFETVENFRRFKCWKCAYLGVKFRHYFDEAQWPILLVKTLLSWKLWAGKIQRTNKDQFNVNFVEKFGMFQIRMHWPVESSKSFLILFISI